MADCPSDQSSPSTPTESRILLVRTRPHPNEPPPPYPTTDRRTRQGRGRTTPRSPRHDQGPSQDSDYEVVGGGTPARQFVAVTGVAHHAFPASSGGDDHEADENTPLLSSVLSHPRNISRRQGGPAPGIDGHTRTRTASHSSTIYSTVSGSPSLAQTLFSAFQPDLDSDIDAVDDGLSVEQRGRLSGRGQTMSGREVEHDEGECLPNEEERLPAPTGDWKMRLRKYFRPMGRRAYYSAVFHLLVLNFPFALASWVYLFVFTLTGTTLLMALPLGALLCFFDLLGARIFSRAELALQSTFHGPLAYTPYPPRPIFYRLREPTLSEMESGVLMTYDKSFYRNAYAMFTDATSYQALFYFLVIKPSITLFLGLLLIVLVPVSFVLILPAPAILRVSRRLGIWQANVAVEGLYLAVR